MHEGETDGLCTGKMGRKNHKQPMGERTELRIEEHNRKSTGNGTRSGAVVGEHVANVLGTRLGRIFHEWLAAGLCIAN